MSLSRIAVFLDTRPLQSGHAIRGIGAYTAQLREHLNALHAIRVVTDPAEADIIHYPFFDLFWPTLPLWSRKPRVVTIHDVIPLQFPEHYPVGIRGKISLKLQKLALKTASAVITDSQASAEAITEYLGISAQKITVTYLAANPQLRLPTPVQLNAIARKYDLPDEYILYVGDINYNKNLPTLLRSLTHLPSKIHLVCVGKNFFSQPIPEWQAIDDVCRQFELQSRVHFLTNIRAVDILELAGIYHQAIAYVQPSLAEGFGLPVLEAMKCRVPVIASRNSSLIEVAGGAAEMIEPTAGNIATAVTMIRKWSSDERDSRIKAGFEWQNQFSWERTAAETAAVYQRLCDG